MVGAEPPDQDDRVQRDENDRADRGAIDALRAFPDERERRETRGFDQQLQRRVGHRDAKRDERVGEEREKRTDGLRRWRQLPSTKLGSVCGSETGRAA